MDFMQIEVAIAAILAFFAGMFIHYIWAIKFWPNRHRLYVWWFNFRRHTKMGVPFKTDIILNRMGYSLGFSFKYKSALWASYIITKSSVDVDVERDTTFNPDPDIPPEYRVYPTDYTGSGYDKGHLAPSAAIDYSRRSNDETFLMSNVVFQAPGLNRQVWSSLENLARRWTKTKGKFYVVAGPVYGKRSRRVKGLPVPRAFYKVFYSKKHRKAIGFLFPNKAIAASRLWDYAMPVAEVEKQTGGKFLKKLGRKGIKIKRYPDINWWKGL